MRRCVHVFLVCIYSDELLSTLRVAEAGCVSKQRSINEFIGQGDGRSQASEITIVRRRHSTKRPPQNLSPTKGSPDPKQLRRDLDVTQSPNQLNRDSETVESPTSTSAVGAALPEQGKHDLEMVERSGQVKRDSQSVEPPISTVPLHAAMSEGDKALHAELSAPVLPP
eukprot:8179382-Pyramimonas_sp.AAC.1